MNQIHTIRLRGPWEYTWLEPSQSDSDDQTPISGQVQTPISWKDCFGSLAGCVRWSRRFQCPTNLDPNERVLLGLEGVRGIERVSLNDVVLPLFLPEEFYGKYDLTDGLLPSNLIKIDTRHSEEDDPSQSGLWCPVLLEIWSTET